MVQLNDFPNEILLKVLEQLPATDLFIVQRVSRRFKQLAAEKIQAKVKRVWLAWPRKDLSSCTHIEPVNYDDLIVLDAMFKSNVQAFRKRSTKGTFLNLLAKCPGVKSIDFGNIFLYGDVEVVKNCQELECLKVGRSEVKEGVWNRVLDQIGPKIVHFLRISEVEYPMPLFDDRLLEMVAEKCPNIKRVDWMQEELLTYELMQAFKKLPKNCWNTLNLFNHLEELNFSDEAGFWQLESVFDEMTIEALDVCAMGKSDKRVSSLKFNVFDKVHRGFGGVRFKALKKLDFIECREGRDKDSSLGCLKYSWFPVLEEFSFPARHGITEDEYKPLFQDMKVVKKLTIAYDYNHGLVPNLPDSAIHQLKSLETIYIEFGYVPRERKDEPKKFLQQIEKYIDGISWLKKLTVDFKYCGCDLWELNVIKEIKRMKEKQDQVKVEMVFRKF